MTAPDATGDDDKGPAGGPDSPARRPLLVVGSYPPVPGEAAAATVAAVRRAWAEGDEVIVVSPRPSAADLAVPVAGVLAGRRLGNVHRLAGEVRGVVLGIEPGVPVPRAPTGRAGLDEAVQRATVRGLCGALASFDSVTLLVSGDPGVRPALLAPLWGMAREVVVASPEAAGLLRDVYGVPPALVSVRAIPPVVPAGVTSVLGSGAADVTPLGPAETTLRDRPRQAVGIAGRAALGPRYPAVRLWFVVHLRDARTALRRRARARLPRRRSP